MKENIYIHVHTSVGELQHTGLVKINAETVAGTFRHIFGQQKVTGSIRKLRSSFPKVFIFQ